MTGIVVRSGGENVQGCGSRGRQAWLAIRSRDMVTELLPEAEMRARLDAFKDGFELIWGSDERDEFGWVRLNASIESCASA